MSTLFDQVVALAQSGMPPREIAAKLNADPGSVRGAISRARRRKIKLPVFPTGNPYKDFHWCGEKDVTVWLSADLAAGLQAEATRRDVKGTDLVRAILTTIVKDGLFSAVLDE